MLKVLVFQKYHNLSDEAKELIEKDRRDGSGKLFRFPQKMLDEKGLVAKEAASWM
jgi:hypothetical protein